MCRLSATFSVFRHRPPAITDAARAIFQELRPQFDGILPARTVHEYVNQAVKDLTGSISIEALPEMAVRLASVRLHSDLLPDQSPGEVQISTSQRTDDADPAGPRELVSALPITVPAGMTHPPVAMTITTTPGSQPPGAPQRTHRGC